MELNDHKARAHALLSASSSGRWMPCPASAKISAAYPVQDTPYTQEGTLAHEIAEAMALQAVTNAPAAPIPEGYSEEMVVHARAYADYIASQCTGSTTVMLEQRVDFSPWVPDGFGTADCILLDGNHMDVIDYKYGQGIEVSAVNNPQMMLYGLGALNEYGFVYDVQSIKLHIFQPRKDNISVWDLTPDELLIFGDAVKQAAELALSEAPPMEAGPHCRFCPHAGRCPELTTACLNACTIGDTIAPDAKSLTVEAVSELLRLEPMISIWLKQIKDRALSDLMGGADIPGYKLVEGKPGNRKWTDELKVAEALSTAGISPEDYTTLQLVSPAVLDKALGKKRAAELVGKLIERSPGAPTVARADDKRPALDRLAQANIDFKEG